MPNTGNASIYVLQDFWSQIIVFNMVQDLIQSNEEDLKDKTDKKKYKYEMRINENVAIGLFKEQFIQLMIETDKRKVNAMFDQLANDMMKNIVPSGFTGQTS
ncbi:MAG: hypothetical protein Ta2B_08740 [Termitinemataceae bacterium]|nr:MAG: hypothetical protein Ta2B_08740 [Termitinemataceae bacterium]